MTEVCPNCSYRVLATEPDGKFSACPNCWWHEDTHQLFASIKKPTAQWPGNVMTVIIRETNEYRMS